MKQLKLLNRNKQQYSLAKITNANYYVLWHKSKDDENAENYIKYRNETCYNETKKALETLDVVRKLQELRSDLIIELSNNNINAKDVKTIKRKITKLNKILDSDNVKHFYNFCDELTATVNLVNDGKLVDFDNFSEHLKDNMAYVFSADVYYNLKPFYDLGDDLSYLYMRSVLTTYDMPLFVPKELKEKFNNYVKEKTGREPVEYSHLTFIPKLRELYDSDYNKKAKELYESVFPEFGFKYEDREKDTEVYTPVWDKTGWEDDLYR